MLSNKVIPKEYGMFRDQVLRGEIPVNEYVAMEMNRIDYLIESEEFYYDDKAIEGYIKFCENEMTLVDGDNLFLLPSFKLWAECLFAWYYFIEERRYNPATHRYEWVLKKKRLINKQFLILPRGAAKTMYASTIQEYSLIVDTETTHQIVTAPTMRQADETLSAIRTSIARHRGPLLSFMTQGSVMSNNSINKVRLASTKKGIENFLTNSLIEIKPMSVDKLQGLRNKISTVDEWLSGRIKEDVIGALEQGASKIDDYIILATSSEGTERNGIGDSIKMELISILRGDYYAPNVSIWYYRLDDISEINNPELWLKANPNLGATVSYETYERDIKRAEAVPTERNDIIAKRFNIPLEGASYYFTYEETLPHKYHNFDNLPCTLGADLSQGDDFTAFTFLFPLGNDRFGIKTRSYISEHKYERLQKAMRKKYDEFIEEGSLIVMPGIILDQDKVYEDLDQFIIEHQYTVTMLGYDIYNAYTLEKNWDADYGEHTRTKVRQGYQTESVPLGEIKKLSENRSLIFDQELMKFAMGNSICLQDSNGNYKLSKRRSNEKIDNVAALMDAYVAYLRSKEDYA